MSNLHLLSFIRCPSFVWPLVGAVKYYRVIIVTIKSNTSLISSSVRSLINEGVFVSVLFLPLTDARYFSFFGISIVYIKYCSVTN